MKKYIIAGIVALSMGMVSCNDYLDINRDPNSPAGEDMTADLLFPAAELAFANSYGDYLRITGGYYAQQYCQYFGTSNYLDYSQFKQSAVRSSSTYTNLTLRTLGNIKLVLAKAEADEDWATYLAATVIRVAAYQALVDCYGSVPYSEALDESNLQPKFDDGLAVYQGLVAELDAALAKSTPGVPVCTNYLFDGGSSTQWIQTANALKLRLLMRMSGAANVQSQLSALVAEGNFPTYDVAWEGFYKNESGQANPYYQEEFATYFGSTQINVALNVALLNTMADSDDPRLEAFFNPNAASGSYWGGVSGTNFSTTATYKATYFCRPNMAYNSPVYLITVSEIEFFLAEYEMKYGSAANAEAHYLAAIQASFDTAGIADDPANTVLTVYPWDAANYMRVIGIQKWIALSGVNNFEAYCELRRIGYPAFGATTGAEIYDVINDAYDATALNPGELYTPILCNTSLGNNQLLERWPYPEAAANRNSNTPSYTGDADPIFWAK